MSKKRIVILGAGYGGVHSAKLLHKKFKKNDEVEVTLIDKNPYHTLLTDLHEVAGRRIEEHGVKVNLEKIFGKKKVDVVTDKIDKIDFDGQKLVSENAEYGYDYLILGSGSEPAYFGVEGAEENSFTIWSYDDAVKIKQHIHHMFEQASTESNENKRRQMLTFVVAGAGFTGVETIGEIAEWQKRLCREYNINPKEVSLKIVEGLPKILPILNDKLIAKSERRLNKLGVEILTQSLITKVTPHSVTLKNGEKIKTNTLIWTAGVQGSSFAANIGLTLGKRGRIQTNEYMQSVDYSNVYVIGDNSYFEEENEGPIPQIVETALQTAETAVDNIEADMENKSYEAFKSNYHGFMVSIGGRYAVAHLGNTSMSGFIAMMMKHIVNIHYLFGVGGFNLIWSYIMHQFFTIKDNRSILGGHFSFRSPNFWLVPLRIFVGYKWLDEGLNKIGKVIEDPSNIFLIPAPPTAATSGATQAAEEGAEAASQWGEALPVPEFIQNIMDWFMEAFFYTADGEFTVLATIFQTGMVIAEVVVGGLLIVGLFTALAAIVSVVMGIMIWTSGMAPTEMLWFLAAGIALIGGAGRTFGLDYYVMPVLKKWWSKTPFARKTYLYID
ncbi:FAD-dependent oxidoreductase [Clostridium sp. D2Q-11]|uniref:NADH:ubiquinone reductase (non-electrogenic) n=1 Tax=Anaeromonas frigoriresistens TaxID=2683708 RepID=A0A942UYX9_9FIRM|nr:FAD-dependent oxidoreductase [Anaeromonas frigoriresistens]MBS4538876.1 FAD-dependent oxidoreductase [Anaeromonas frigoriresistens]